MAKDSLETQLQVRHSCEQAANRIKDVKEWTKEMKAKDEKQKQKANGTQASINPEDLPPVRSDVEKMAEYEQQIKRSKTMGDEPEHSFEDEAARQEADTYKDKGNKCAKLNQYPEAVHFYQKAINLFSGEHTYHSNLALCYYRLERYNDCIDSCNTSIRLQPKFAKAFFRRSQAYEALGETSKSIEDMKVVIQLEPRVHQHKLDLERLKLRFEKENMERGASRELEKRVWLSPNNNQKYVSFINKNPNYRSKRPMKRIRIEEVQPTLPPTVRDSGERIPDAVIDKLFNNNTGECTAEPLPSRHTLDFGAFYRRKTKSPPREQEDDLDEDLPPPTTAVQFLKTWRELSLQKRFVYLKNLSDKPLNKILGASLDSEILSDIIKVLYDMFVTNNLPVDQILLEISKNDQTQILSLFFGTEDKQSLRSLINYMSFNGVEAAVINEIEQKFGV